MSEMNSLDPRPIDTAPKDGTMLRLLVDYTDGDHALEDDTKAWTIGFNSLEDTGEDRWQFSGWCWCHDHFIEGRGTPIGWLPFHDPDTRQLVEQRDRLAEAVKAARDGFNAKLFDDQRLELRDQMSAALAALDPR